MSGALLRRVLPLLACALALPFACEPRRGARGPTPEPAATDPAASTTATATAAPTVADTTAPTGTAAPTATGAPTTPPPTFDPAIVLGPAWTPTGLVLPPGWSPNPTGAPWPIPTTFPTGFPTALPTGMPTGFPTALPFPTGTATGAPTGKPTSAPTSAPPSVDGWPTDHAAMEEVVLLEVNKRRAAGATCGGKPYAPVPPLTMDAYLRTSARRHSKDMATRGFFDHQNPDGQSPSDRMRAAGYLGVGYSGENIAAGRDTPAGTVQQWMDSPGHCSNVMHPGFQKLGVGYAYAGGSKYKHYWTQNFAGN